MSGFISIARAALCLNWVRSAHSLDSKENLKALHTNSPFTKTESQIARDESRYKKILKIYNNTTTRQLHEKFII